MRLTRHEEPAGLLAVAEPLLSRTEAENALLYGILWKLVAGDTPHAEPYLASLQDDAGETVAVALCTPPFVMLMTAFPPAGQALLVEDLRRARPDLSGVLGAEPAVSELAAAWAEATGQTVRPNMRQRAYRLDRVRRPDVPGRLRACGEADRARGETDRARGEADRACVEAWTHAFVANLGIHGSEHLVPVARHAFDQGGFFLWEHDGAARSMAARVGETPRSARIGFVYTPPDQRSRGYAAACTAAVSQHYLDAGKRFCCLHADMANPVSNSIYQRTGKTTGRTTGRTTGKTTSRTTGKTSREAARHPDRTALLVGQPACSVPYTDRTALLVDQPACSVPYTDRTALLVGQPMSSVLNSGIECGTLPSLRWRSAWRLASANAACAWACQILIDRRNIAPDHVLA